MTTTLTSARFSGDRDLLQRIAGDIERCQLLRAWQRAAVKTLDPDELKASAFHVAFAADSYEKKQGQDKF